MAVREVPKNLEDQIFFVYLRVFGEMEKIFPLRRNTVYLKEDHDTAFKDRFASLRLKMTERMKDKRRNNKDSHK